MMIEPNVLKCEQLAIEREIALYSAETDNIRRAAMLQNIKGSIANFPKEQQADLLAKILEIETIGKNGSNITYISGANNIGNNYNPNNRRRKR